MIVDHVSIARGHKSFIRGGMYLHESKSNEMVHSCFFENSTRLVLLPTLLLCVRRIEMSAFKLLLWPANGMKRPVTQNLNAFLEPNDIFV
jgi:hypothetical protein